MSRVETLKKTEAIKASKDGSLIAQIETAHQDSSPPEHSHPIPQKQKAQQTSLDIVSLCQAGKRRDEEAQKLFQQEVDHIIL
ncbi:hypothetical protein V8B97DRAFT_2011450 [Scleroderma yunnanense]